MRNQLIAALLCLAATAGSAVADTRATQQANLEKYTPYLQAPVDSFAFWTLHKWQLVGPEKVVVWSTINDAYLVTVEKPCAGLEWARGIGLSSKQSRQVSRRMDFVTVGHDQCRIQEIRPIDTRRMDADRKATGG
jgi:hypothetical protein